MSEGKWPMGSVVIRAGAPVVLVVGGGIACGDDGAVHITPLPGVGSAGSDIPTILVAPGDSMPICMPLDRAVVRLLPGTHEIKDACVLEESVCLQVEPGALISVRNAGSLIIRGPIEAGPSQIFDLSEADFTSETPPIQVSAASDIHAAWFGFLPRSGGADNLAKNRDALSALQQALPSAGSTIRFLPGRHPLSGSIELAKPQHWVGVSASSSVICCASELLAAPKPIFRVTGDHVAIEDMGFDAGQYRDRSSILFHVTADYTTFKRVGFADGFLGYESADASILIPPMDRVPTDSIACHVEGIITRFERCTFSTRGVGILFSGREPNCCVVDSCAFLNCWRAGVQLASGYNNVVRDSTFEYCGTPDDGETAGALIGGKPDANTLDHVSFESVHFEENFSCDVCFLEANPVAPELVKHIAFSGCSFDSARNQYIACSGSSPFRIQTDGAEPTGDCDTDTGCHLVLIDGTYFITGPEECRREKVDCAMRIAGGMPNYLTIRDCHFAGSADSPPIFELAPSEFGFHPVFERCSGIAPSGITSLGRLFNVQTLTQSVGRNYQFDLCPDPHYFPAYYEPNPLYLCAEDTAITGNLVPVCPPSPIPDPTTEKGWRAWEWMPCSEDGRLVVPASDAQSSGNAFEDALMEHYGSLELLPRLAKHADVPVLEESASAVLKRKETMKSDSASLPHFSGLPSLRIQAATGGLLIPLRAHLWGRWMTVSCWIQEARKGFSIGAAILGDPSAKAISTHFVAVDGIQSGDRWKRIGLSFRVPDDLPTEAIGSEGPLLGLLVLSPCPWKPCCIAGLKVYGGIGERFGPVPLPLAGIEGEPSA